MKRICFLGLVALFVACLSTPSFALDPFGDDFARADSADVGNGWADGGDDGISVSIANGEVLIEGTQDVDWERNGISRDVSDISSLSFDFLIASFNAHMRIDDTNAGGYIDVYCWPGGPFSFANSVDGGWPGWVEIGGSQSIADDWNTLGIEKVGASGYQVMHNGVPIGDVLDNPGIVSINSIALTPDSAVDAVGSMRIDNVVIDGGETNAVKPSGKLSTAWGEIKSSL
ncbi:hypothetical protein ACFL6S_34025 [Candidatus Poribacteria bacterium]